MYDFSEVYDPISIPGVLSGTLYRNVRYIGPGETPWARLADLIRGTSLHRTTVVEAISRGEIRARRDDQGRWHIPVTTFASWLMKTYKYQASTLTDNNGRNWTRTELTTLAGPSSHAEAARMLGRSRTAIRVRRCRERKKMMSKEVPVEIKISLRAPIVAVGLIHLDGLLAQVATRIRLGDAFWADNGNVQGEALRAKSKVSARLPISRSVHNGVTVHRASAAHFKTDKVATARWRKRWPEEHEELIDFGRFKPQIQHKFGPYRAYDMPVVYRVASEVYFWAVGHPVKLQAWLELLGHIGKKASQGFGEIRSVEVKEVDHEWSLFRGQGAAKQPTRAIPVSFLAGDPRPGRRVELAGFRPPYWEPNNQEPCIVPHHTLLEGD